MAIVIYGMNHASAPLEVREKATFPPDDLDGAVRRLLRTGPVTEGLILSTCNRTELLVTAPVAGEAGEALRRFLTGERRVTGEELERHCYLHAEGNAVRHVFRVASSLDSMIVGEAQILGQVKEAYAAAARAGALGTVLNALMQRSFSVAKKVRSDTGLARYPVSIAHAAVSLARDIFADLGDNAVLILGAGKMARLAALHLVAGGVRSVIVANRSYQRAAELARDLGGRAAPFDRLFEEMQGVDIVIASTAAPHFVITHDEALRLSRARRGRPLFLVDIAVPRDVDPRVNEIPNVYLYDLDDLRRVVDAHRNERRHEAERAEAIVEREAIAYLAWLRAQDVGPLIVDLRRQLHALGTSEVARFRGRFGPLTPEQQKGVEELAASLVNKFLHQPIQALKRAAVDGGAAEIEFLRRIFGLGAGRRDSTVQAPQRGPDAPDGSSPGTEVPGPAPRRGEGG
jgi:glutamyl-tRNA reductase